MVLRHQLFADMWEMRSLARHGLTAGKRWGFCLGMCAVFQSHVCAISLGDYLHSKIQVAS